MSVNLKELLMEYLSKEGFRPEETSFGVYFKVNGLSFCFFYDQEDELYFGLTLPDFFNCTDDNEDIVLRVINSINRDIKCIKLSIVDMKNFSNEDRKSVWAAYESLADTTPELNDFIPRAVGALQAARQGFYERMQKSAE